MTKGVVDDQSRALVAVRIGKRGDRPEFEVLFWVDTAFTGSLVIPQRICESIGLSVESTAEAILADGSMVDLETFGCAVEWMGSVYDTQVVSNASEFGLIGTFMLDQHKLIIDYTNRTVEIE